MTQTMPTFHLISIVAVLLSTQVQSQFVGTRFTGVGSQFADAELTIGNSPVTASGLFAQANWQDNGGVGTPDDFSSNLDIPGDVIGVDEDNWALVGSGLLTVHTTGNYRFRTGTDDASRIILAGRTVVVQVGCCANVDSGSIPLVAGQQYAIQTVLKEGSVGGGGEFSVSRDGGAFVLLGSGSADFSVTPDIGTPACFSPTNAGLTARTFSVAGMPTQNRDTDTFLAGNPTPLSTSTVTSTNTGALPVDTLVTFEGFVRIDAADDIAVGAQGIQVKFVYDTDDNGRLVIAGQTVMENDGTHSTGHFSSTNNDLLSAGTGDNTGGTQILTFPSAGFYTLSAYVHNANAAGSGVVLSSIGGTSGSVVEVPSNRLFLPTVAVCTGCVASTVECGDAYSITLGLGEGAFCFDFNEEAITSSLEP